MVEPTQQPTYQPAALDTTIGQLEAVDAGTSAVMQDSSSQSLLDELNEKRRRLWLWPWLLTLGIIIVCVTIYLELSLVWIGLLACVLVAAVIFAGYRDTLKKTTVLLYDFDDKALGAFANLDSAFNQSSASQCIWHVITKAAVLDRKYHAGASSVIDTEKIQLSKSAPPGLKTNILPMVTALGRKRLYFLPDRILMLDAVGFGAIDYEHLQLHLERSTFITGDVTAPPDAHVVSYTWRYVNKRDGGPDRRFRDNPQLPVIETGDLVFSTDSGFFAKLKFSNFSAAETLVNGIQEFTSAAFRRTPNGEPSPNSAEKQQVAPVPEGVTPTASGSDKPLQSNIRLIIVGVILLFAITAVMFASFEWRNSTTSTVAHNRNGSADETLSVSIPGEKPTVMPSVPQTAAIPGPMSTTIPSVSPITAVPLGSKSVVKDIPENTFVTLIARVSVRSPSGKMLTLQRGSHFRLIAAEGDQLVIRYYDGRKYSIPVSVTNYR
jgi:hypothetical protein